MSKTTLTLSGRFLWITASIVLNVFSFLPQASAEDFSHPISLESVRHKTIAIPLPAKQQFLPLVKKMPLASAGQSMASASQDEPVQITKPQANKPHAVLPNAAVSGGVEERAKAEVIASLIGGEDDAKSSNMSSMGRTMQLASINPDMVASDAVDEPSGITKDKMIALSAPKPFKLADAVPLVPDSGGIKIDHAARVAPQDTGRDGDEEVDEKFFAKIVRPHDVSKFMKIMKKQGFISLNGAPAHAIPVGSTLSKTKTLHGQGPVVVRPRTKSEMASHDKRIHEDDDVVAQAGSGDWTWPVDLSVSQRISSGFGMRVHPVTGKRAFHQGVDIAAPIGTRVLAAANGVVSLVTSHPHLGHYIRIEHPDGTFSLYGHLSDWKVAEGDVVHAGDVIGEIGMSGRTTGAHLDFSIRLNDEAVNPLSYLDVPQSVAANSDPKYLAMR
jgi:hypothetical protein